MEIVQKLADVKWPVIEVLHTATAGSLTQDEAEPEKGEESESENTKVAI